MLPDALALNAALLLAALLACWLLSFVIGKASFADAIWGFAMAGLACASWWQLAERGAAAALLLAITAAWGVRLGAHLLRRFLKIG
ncbi:MAG: DUF1295 domain-containing protein, partial [Alteraurantiacibacter sp.]